MTRPRNDLTIYNTVADRWWSEVVRWVAARAQRLFAATGLNVRFGPNALLHLQTESPRCQMYEGR